MRPKIYIISLLFLILLVPLVNSEEPTTKLELERNISDARAAVEQLEKDGFETQRVKDLLKTAIQIYEGQKKLSKNSRNYELVIKNINEINNLKDQAYIALDDVSYARGLYESFVEENLETIQVSPEIISEPERLINEMEFEFKSERYEEARDLAIEASSKIIEVEGQNTALSLAYTTTTQTLKSFIVKNWLAITIVTVGGIFLFFVSRNRVIYFKTKMKIKNLNKESIVLENLLKETQKDYFERGKMSEETYKIRIRKFSEIMRDINKEIPLLKEELAKRKRTSKGAQDELTQKREIKKSTKKLNETKRQSKKVDKIIKIGNKVNKKYHKKVMAQKKARRKKKR
jgi:tetratricopeptide (TPR) repeat protein